MLDYISRVKTLRNEILDVERIRGRLDHRIISEIDAISIRAFCDGFGLEYRLQKSEHFGLRGGQGPR